MALRIHTSVLSTKELTKTTLKETGMRRTSEAEDLNSGLPRANRAPIIPGEFFFFRSNLVMMT